MSTKAQKLKEFARAWRDADSHYAADYGAAGADEKLRHEIDRNWWQHQTNWALAATAALEENNEKVEALYLQAKEANDAIIKGRKDAEKIAKIVRASGAVAKSLSGLLKALV